MSKIDSCKLCGLVFFNQDEIITNLEEDLYVLLSSVASAYKIEVQKTDKFCKKCVNELVSVRTLVTGWVNVQQEFDKNLEQDKQNEDESIVRFDILRKTAPQKVKLAHQGQYFPVPEQKTTIDTEPWSLVAFLLGDGITKLAKLYAKPHKNLYERKFVCFCCQMVFDEANTLCLHLQSKHNTLYSYDPSSPSKVFDGQEQQMPKNFYFACQKCDTTNTSALIMCLHYGDKHLKKDLFFIESSTFKNNALKISCQTCNKLFKRPYELLLHNRTHTGEQPYECSVCNKLFSYRSNLQVHERIHKNLRPCICALCDRDFRTSSHLKRHLIAKHKNIFPDTTKLPSNFINTDKNESLLKRNQKDAQEKPRILKVEILPKLKLPKNIWKHKCECCAKIFKRRCGYRKHLRTHSGIKPYKCSECERAFADRSNYKKHLLKHGNEKDALIERPETLEDNDSNASDPNPDNIFDH